MKRISRISSGYVLPLSKTPDPERISKWRLIFCASSSFVFAPICREKSGNKASGICQRFCHRGRQKEALQTRGLFWFPTGFSASFPDILLPHSDSSWRYERLCEPVSCAASNAQKAGWAVLKADAGLWAGEKRRGV